MGRHLDNHERVQAVLYAEIHGDDAASERYDVSVRSIQRYRALVQDGESDLAKIVAEYARVVAPEKTEPVVFGQWLQRRVRETSDLLLDTARASLQRMPGNPEATRVLNEHVATLLEHTAALEYLSKLFGTEDNEPVDRTDPEARPVAQAAWSARTSDGAPPSA